MSLLLIGGVTSRRAWQHLPAGEAFATMFTADSSGQKPYLEIARGGLWRSHDGGQSW